MNRVQTSKNYMLWASELFPNVLHRKSLPFGNPGATFSPFPSPNERWPNDQGGFFCLFGWAAGTAFV